VFGVSLPEFLVLGTVALLVLGPEKLPGLLRTMGQWLAKIRKLTTEVRHQSGIDEVLRAEGFDGGLNELRTIMRGGPASVPSPPVRAPVLEQFVADRSREYPPEGPDAYGALPEDLVSPPVAPAPPALAAPLAPLALPEAPPEATAALPEASRAAALPAPAPPLPAPAPPLPAPAPPLPAPAPPLPAPAPPLPGAEAAQGPAPGASKADPPEATR
jgi:sec-independent protein translocase protein TatB